MALLGRSENTVSDGVGVRRLQSTSNIATTSPPSTLHTQVPGAFANGSGFQGNGTLWDFNETGFDLNFSYAPSGVPTHAPSVVPSKAPSSAPTANILKFVHSNDAEIISSTFRLYGSLYLLFFFAFCFLRKRFPRFYNVRSWIPEIRTEMASNAEYGFFSWCWKIHKISDEDLLETSGMDAMCYLRCLRFGAKLSLLGSINAAWLVPLFLTSKPSPETANLSDPFVLMSMANVPNNSTRFVGPVVAAYIIFLGSMYLLTKEFDWFTKYRHIYLSQPEPRNYSIYVSGIPENFQSSYALADYFRQCTSWKEAVYTADVAMDIPALEAKVAKRDNLVEKIESIMALERKTGFTKTHREVKLHKGEGVKKVESIRTYMKQLERLNHQITLAAGHITRSNHRMRQHLTRSSTTNNISNLDLELSERSISEQRESLDKSHRSQGGRRRSIDGSHRSQGRRVVSIDDSHRSQAGRRGLGIVAGASAPTLETEGTSFSSMRGLEQMEGSFSRVDHCGDIEEGSNSQPETDSIHRLSTEQMLHPSSSEDSKNCAVTEPSTDDSKRIVDGSGPESPHPFLTMFGLNSSLFNRSTLDLNAARDNEEYLHSVSTDTPEKVYEDRMDESYNSDYAHELEDYEDQDILMDNEMLGFDLDGSIYDEEELDTDIGQGEYNSDMLNTVGLVPDISGESLDMSSDNQIRRSLSRESSGSRSSWIGGAQDAIRSNSKGVRQSMTTVRDMGMKSAKLVGSKTVHVSNQVKKVSQVGASKVRAAGSLGVHGVRKAGSYGVTGVRKAADFGISKIQQAPDLGVNLGAHIVTSAAAVVPLRLNRTEGKPREAGFVIFRDLYTTQATRQMLQHHIRKLLIGFVSWIWLQSKVSQV